MNRPAPEPTIPYKASKRRLNPVFVEWMMGLPTGHVTGHGLSHPQALTMLGNGVVPPQAALALNALGLPDLLMRHYRTRAIGAAA